MLCQAAREALALDSAFKWWRIIINHLRPEHPSGEKEIFVPKKCAFSTCFIFWNEFCNSHQKKFFNGVQAQLLRAVLSWTCWKRLKLLNIIDFTYLSGWRKNSISERCTRESRNFPKVLPPQQRARGQMHFYLQWIPLQYFVWCSHKPSEIFETVLLSTYF